jgi:hypothetical protein
MDLKTAINYVTQYRRNGRSCYVRAANRGATVLQTNRGAVEFVGRLQVSQNGRSKTNCVAYLRWHVPAGTGRRVLSREFASLVEVSE